MFDKSRISIVVLLAMMLAAAGAPALNAQTREPAIDVEHYTIDAEINPRTQDIEADVLVRFRAVENETRYLDFELHNDLELFEVLNEEGDDEAFFRSFDEFSVRVTLTQSMEAGEERTMRFRYGGRLTGREESPVWGIKFAAIQDDYAYLLYPARWFPVSGYTTDRFTAEMHVTVPEGFRVIASGAETSEATDSGDVTYTYTFTQPSFPGSIAVVRGEPYEETVGGITATLYLHDDAAEMASALGQDVIRSVNYLSGLYGIAPDRNLTVVETETGTPNGYTAPGLLFLSPGALQGDVNQRLLVNQIARQWWGMLVSPASRNHLWLTNGMARFSELMWLRDTAGPASEEAQMHTQYVEALTVDNVPLIQSARLEDYSPEFWAATAGKGTAVLNMLEIVIGEDAFDELLTKFPEQHAWQSVYTEDFRTLAEQISGKSLEGFFIQWIESSGAPEFDIEYTVYRTQQGFRVMGKITQDLDTFRMPVELRIETEGNPETKQIEVVGPSTDFVVDTFGKPLRVEIDPDGKVLRFSDDMRVEVAIRRGEQFAEIGDFARALTEYGRALEVNRYSSLAHYRIAEAFFLQRNYQSAANEFRLVLSGDLEPAWTEVWAHINMGKIFDISDQRERAVNEYNLALRTKDNTQGAQELAAQYLQEPYERPRQNI